jgi:hypothetical protein
VVLRFPRKENWPAHIALNTTINIKARVILLIIPIHLLP